MEILIIHILNGISFGMLLFLLASGLTLIFGLMNVINLTHGGYYLWGAYIGLEVMRFTGNFALSVLVAGISVAIIGILMQRLFLHRLYKQPLAQVLLTIGFSLMFSDLTFMIWGGATYNVPKPLVLLNPVYIAGYGFPTYRFFVILVGVSIALLLWWFHKRTRIGARVRAAVDDQEIAQAIGINIYILFTIVFGLGAFLAGLSGVIGGAFIAVYPGVDWDILLLAVLVIVVGGVGSLKGALVGGLVIGLIDNFGKIFFPQLAMFTIYAPMVIILILKPSGLFGREL